TTTEQRPLERGSQSRVAFGRDTTYSSCAHDPLHVLWCEKPRDRYRPGEGTKEAVDLRLVSAQGGEELLHFGRRRRRQIGELECKLIHWHHRGVPLLFVVGQGPGERRAPRETSL